MKSNGKSRNKEIEELLESDDELPTTYVEIPDIPAYQNDNRFENTTRHIEDDEKSESVDEASFDSAEETNKTNTKIQQDKKILIRKGFLNKRDVYCLKSIESLISDTTLLWFVDFLIYKDLQTKHFNFIRGCLAGDISNHYSVETKPCDMDVKDYKLKLVFN